MGRQSSAPGLWLARPRRCLNSFPQTTGRPPEIEVEPAERKACSRFRPHTLVPEKELLDLPEFTSKNEFLHHARVYCRD